MDAIGYPDQYHIYSYVENSSGSILDQTYKVNVPPLRCKDLSCVIPSWPPIEVYPRIPKNYSISIHPNDLIRFNNLAYGSRYNVSLVQNVTNTHGINLSFSPKMIKLPLNGSNNWQLQITTPGNITSNNYTLMVNEKFIPISGSIGGTTKYHSFNIEVLKPPGLIESVRQFLTPQITFEILELAVRHAVKKPFIQIREVAYTIPFDIAHLRTIPVDFRWVDSMNRCRDEIEKQIQEIENNPDKIIETPISIALDLLELNNSSDPQSKILMNLTSQVEKISSKVDMLSTGKSYDIITERFRPSIDDTAKDEKIVIDTVMREICNLYTNTEREEFSIDEIIQTQLGAYSREYVFQFIAKFESQSGYIKLLTQDRVRLTDAGKRYCNLV